MADKYIFDRSLVGDYDVQPFVDKEDVYVLDSNGGNYNGQILIETSSISNSGRWCDYSQATIQIPYTIAMTSSTDITGASYNGFMIGLKNSYTTLLDSVEIQYNNVNVVQVQAYSNFYISYKLMTEFSQDDVVKWGSQLGFSPDSPASWSQAAGASVNGNGITNNQNQPNASNNSFLGGANVFQNYNAGLYARGLNTSYPLSTAQKGYGGLNVMTSASLANSIAKNYFTDDGGSTTARKYSWAIIATIRLKDLQSNFFEKLPMVKGALLRFTLNYNSVLQTVTTATAGNTLIQAAPSMLSGRTNPLIMGSAATGSSMNVVVGSGAGAVLTISSGVAKTNSAPIVSNPLLSNCRLYVPNYLMNPVYEEEYLKERIRKVDYTDIYSFQITAVAANASFNSILSNGIAGMKQLVVIPQVNGAANNNATIALSPFQSIFDSSPATTCPLAAIGNFNAQVSGRNVFQQNMIYDFDIYQNEIAEANAISGGLVTGMTNGLLSRFNWDNGYRYYVVDLARRLPAEDLVPKSISVQGINNTGVIMDYFCYVVYSRCLSIDIQSSAIV